jgi:hypothetical protein
MGQATRQRVVERFSLAAEARGIGAVYSTLFDGAPVERS